MASGTFSCSELLWVALRSALFGTKFGTKFGLEDLREQVRLVGSLPVVQVAHRGLQVGVSHPMLDLERVGPVDRQGAEDMAKVMERQGP